MLGPPGGGGPAGSSGEGAAAREPNATENQGTAASAAIGSPPDDAGKRRVVLIPARTAHTQDGPSPSGAPEQQQRRQLGHHVRSPSSESSSSSSSSTGGSAGGSKDKEVGLCRICLEEDTLSQLETPCACTGTQRHAHHECIQRWINEKGHLRCEICDQQYEGNFTVPPAPVPAADGSGGTLFSPMLALRMEGELGHAGDRASLDFLDESDHYYQRNPLASWCFTFVIFVMFLVVLHHTMTVADTMDAPGGSGGSSSSGGGGGGVAPTDSDEYATSLSLFLFWIGTKAFLIGIPLYTVMRIAARQARQEQYEAMLRSGAFEVPARRFVWRVQAMQQRERDVGHAGGGVNAV